MADLHSLSPGLSTLLDRFQGGGVSALARAISVVENQREGFQHFLHALLEQGPQARRVGFTGPPGAGKSSLVAAASASYRSAGERVGIVTVDPTSP